MLNAFQQMVEREEPEATYEKTDYANVRQKFRMTSFGYWILPDGSLISLLKSMSHGQVALKIEPGIDAIHNNTHGEEDVLDPVAAQIIAQNDLNWIRISLGWGLTVDWGSKITKRQIDTLEIVADDHGAEDDPEIWFTGGPGSKKLLMRTVHQIERQSHA